MLLSLLLVVDVDDDVDGDECVEVDWHIMIVVQGDAT